MRFMQFVREIRVDNFGAWGTRHIFQQMKPATQHTELAAVGGRNIPAIFGECLSISGVSARANAGDKTLAQ